MPWLDSNVQRSQTTKAQGPLCYAFSRQSLLLSVSFPVTMATYVVQRKESFTRNVRLGPKQVRKCGVSVLTNQKDLRVSAQVLCYFGMHNLFDVEIF